MTEEALMTHYYPFCRSSVNSLSVGFVPILFSVPRTSPLVYLDTNRLSHQQEPPSRASRHPPPSTLINHPHLLIYYHPNSIGLIQTCKQPADIHHHPPISPPVSLELALGQAPSSSNQAVVPTNINSAVGMWACGRGCKPVPGTS